MQRSNNSNSDPKKSFSPQSNAEKDNNLSTNSTNLTSDGKTIHPKSSLKVNWTDQIPTTQRITLVKICQTKTQKNQKIKILFLL